MGQIRECQRRPRHDDELPPYDDWDHFVGDEGEFWATRYRSKAVGVDVVPESPEIREASSSNEPRCYHVEIVVIDPVDDWTGCVIHECSVGNPEEAERKAEEFRERLDSYVMMCEL